MDAAITQETSPSAPGQLQLVQAFVNTRDVEAGRDELVSADLLKDWLERHDLLEPGTTVTKTDVSRVQNVREALRTLLLAHDTDSAPDPATVATLNHEAAQSQLVVRFDQTGTGGLEPSAGGVDRALARLFAIILTAMTDGTWERLKACQNDTCQWAFYDYSKNRSRTWCSMAVCGSRAKARAYRRRKAQEA